MEKDYSLSVSSYSKIPIMLRIVKRLYGFIRACDVITNSVALFLVIHIHRHYKSHSDNREYV